MLDEPVPISTQSAENMTLTSSKAEKTFFSKYSFIKREWLFFLILLSAVLFVLAVINNGVGMNFKEEWNNRIKGDGLFGGCHSPVLEPDPDFNADNNAEQYEKQVHRAKQPHISGSIWPLPQKLEYGKTNRTVPHDGIIISFEVEGTNCDILEFAKSTYTKRWFFPKRNSSEQENEKANDARENSSNSTTLNLLIKLRQNCPSADEFPQFDMDEEYFLEVPSTGAAILEAKQVWGILRGLETFSHLIHKMGASYHIRTATIHDWPEYRVRGILLDTSRHYLRPEIIKRQLDIMAQNKMNLLHWHIVDMESFPYVSAQFPNLSQGAYSPKHIYSPVVVKQLLNYARLRGIRVMVEFDTPGHMNSWNGQHGLLAECYNEAGNIVLPALIDPTNEANFGFLRRFFHEVLQQFPDHWIHLGGDEAHYWMKQCWERNPKVAEFMRAHQLDNTTELEHFYIRKLQHIFTGADGLFEGNDKRRMVFWDEVYAIKPNPASSIINFWQEWKGRESRHEALANLTRDGYQVILSSCWYLNLIQYGADWSQGNDSKLGEGPYYDCNPREFDGTEAQKQLILGGTATMWAEYVDGTNLEARLWPRASAVAERLWSDPQQTYDAARSWPRLHEHRCRMVSRGYRAQPLNGPDFCPDEWTDDSDE